MDREESPPGEPADLASPDRDWDREASLCLLALIVGALISLLFWWSPYFDPRSDACMYILVARNLLAGEGCTLLGQPFVVRPPGFSVMIAPILAVFDTDPRILNLFVNLLGVACVALLFGLLRRPLGSRPALALSALMWMNPGFRSLCNQVMSDVPSVALAIGCLLLERGTRGRHAAHGLWLGLAIGLCALVRTMNGLLVPAIVVATAMGWPWTWRAWRRTLYILVGAALLIVPWELRNRGAEIPSPTEQTAIYNYGTGMFHTERGDPDSPRLTWSEITDRIPQQLSRTAEALGTRLGAGTESDSAPWIGGLALICLGFVALRRREPAEIWCLGLLAVVSVYFAFDDRLVLPLFVFGAAAVVEVHLLLFRRLRPTNRWPTHVVVLAVALLALLDGRQQPDYEPLGAAEQTMREVVAFVDEHVPEGAPVASQYGWKLGVYMEDRAAYSLSIVAKRGDWKAVHEMLRRHGVDHVLLYRAQGEGALSELSIQQGKRTDRMARELKTRFSNVGTESGWTLLERGVKGKGKGKRKR